MTSPDLKKLITGFLVLAIATSSFALIFSSSFFSPTPSEVAITAESEKKRFPTISENAFVEPLPEPAYPKQDEPGPGETVTVPPDPTRTLSPDNLTDSFVERMVEELISQNLDGPQLDESGRQFLSLPTEDYVATLIGEAVLNRPAQRTEPKRSREAEIALTYSSNDLIRYVEAVNNILITSIAGPEFKEVLAREPSPEQIAAVELTLEQAGRRLVSLRVPQPLVVFHNALLSFLEDQRSIFEAAGDYRRDPLKTLVMLENSGAVIDRGAANLQNALLDTDFKKTLSGAEEGGKLLSLLYGLLGVGEAHAALGFSIVFDPKALAQAIKDALRDIKKWIYETLVAVMINRIINRLQNQIVNWIAGGGRPKFITNWKSFLSQAASEAAGAAIDKITDGRLCAGLAPLVSIALRPLADAADATNCTLGDIANIMRNFYSDFQNGGWVAYSASLEPRNNFYGSLIITRDIVVREAARAEEAARNEGVSSQGFKGVKRCVSQRTVEFPPTPGEEELGGATVQVCDKWEEVTPGSAVGHALFGSQNWKVLEVVNARRLQQLITAIIDAAMTRIIQSGLAALSNLPDDGRGAGGSGSGVGAGGPPPPLPGGEPGGVPNPGDISDTKASLLEAAEAQLDIIRDTIDTLNQLALRCPTLSGQVSARLQEAEDLKDRIEDLKSQISATSDPTTLDVLNDRLRNLTEQVANANSAARDLSENPPPGSGCLPASP